MAFVGVDLGTTNIKAALFSGPLFEESVILSRPAVYRREGKRVEFDAGEYFLSVVEMLKELGEKSGGKIDMITLTGQAESFLLLGSNNKPLRPAISWMDERGADECEKLAKLFSDKEIYAVTGQKAIIPTWPATKILNLRKTESDIFSKTKAFIMIKDYIAFMLTGKMAAEKSIATFSLYFDIHQGCYWKKMLDACGIREEQLPPLVEPMTVLGGVKSELALGPAYSDAKVNAGTLDHFAGMIGNGIVSPGPVSESTGTVMALCALLKPPLSGKETAALHYGPFPGTLAVLPVAESGGVCLQWFKDNFMQSVSLREIDALAAKESAEKLLFLPYLTGVNAPEFDGNACGVFFGLRAGINPAAMARAVMEGVALLFEKNLAELRRSGTNLSYIVSSGGAAKSDLWCQIKADITGLEIRVSAVSEAACFGAAIAGAVSYGAFNNYAEAAAKLAKTAKIYKPQNSEKYRAKKAVFDTLYRGMMEAVMVLNT